MTSSGSNAAPGSPVPGPDPIKVCLCGSTRFKQAFIDANFQETMAGKIVLTVGWFSHADAAIYTPTSEEKAALDALHLKKVEMADEVLILNVDGYIGESTRREMHHAHHHGKVIRFLEPDKAPVLPPKVVFDNHGFGHADHDHPAHEDATPPRHRYHPKVQTLAEVHRRFQFHPFPYSTEQGERLHLIGAMCDNLATELMFNCPESRELSVALTHLQDVCMWARAAITNHENIIT